MATIKYIFYFCNVKIYERYMSAAISSVFCAINLLIRYIRILVCGSSNAHKVSARMILTAPSAVFCLMSK
jgi:hypothetical protein